MVIYKLFWFKAGILEFKNATTPDVWDKEAIIFSTLAQKVYKSEDYDLLSFHYSTDLLNLKNVNSLKILHLHGVPSKRRIIDYNSLNNADAFLAVSKYVLDGWDRLYNVSKLKKDIAIVLNGIDLSKSTIPQNRDVDLLFFGRLIKNKGVDTLIKAVYTLKEKYNISTKTVIVGSGPEKKHLENLKKQLGLEHEISFLGSVSDMILEDNLSRAKICVFPSYAKEGVMCTVLEACLSKSCVVVANSCSIREFIKDGENGILFKPQNEEDLALKIKDLLLDKKKREELSEKGFLSLKKMSWESQSKKIYEFYKKILKNKINETEKCQQNMVSGLVQL